MINHAVITITHSAIPDSLSPYKMEANKQKCNSYNHQLVQLLMHLIMKIYSILNYQTQNIQKLNHIIAIKLSIQISRHAPYKEKATLSQTPTGLKYRNYLRR